MKMEWTAEVLRGWPLGGARERIESVKSGSTLVNGDIVTKQADGTVDKVGATASKRVGLVIRGNGDSTSAAQSGIPQAVVLWGNFIAKVSNYAAGAYTPGSPVTAANGVYALANGTTDPEVGFVLDVIAASATQTASLVIAAF